MVTTPKVAPDLRAALDRLPKPDGKPEVTVTVHLPAVETPKGTAAPKSGPSVDLQFHRGTVVTFGGHGQPA